MMADNTRVALFIDAENSSAQHAGFCMEHCLAKGVLTIRRCYGGEAGLRAWQDAMAEHHILPMHTPPGASKQNASDFALIIDAVSLLHRDKFDHAVIVSSDADFLLLALHIRENGKTASGIGAQKTDVKLRSAFSEFLVLRSSEPTPPKAKPVAREAAAAPPAKKTSNSPQSATPIDAEWLSVTFRELAGLQAHCNYEDFKRLLAKKRPGYQRGYGKADIYIGKSGQFDIKEKSIFLRASKQSA